MPPLVISTAILLYAGTIPGIVLCCKHACACQSNVEPSSNAHKAGSTDIGIPGQCANIFMSMTSRGQDEVIVIRKIKKIINIWLIGLCTHSNHINNILITSLGKIPTKGSITKENRHELLTRMFGCH